MTRRVLSALVLMVATVSVAAGGTRVESRVGQGPSLQRPRISAGPAPLRTTNERQPRLSTHRSLVGRATRVAFREDPRPTLRDLGGPESPTLSVGEGTDAELWAQAIGLREWSFPRDHGAHPAYRMEWWYFTGNLGDARGDRYGYQLTVFRVGLRSKAANPENPWSVRDIYLAHFALTEAKESRFRFADRVSRTGPGLAGASLDGLDVWLFGWAARMEAGTIRVQAETRDMAIDLKLTPRKSVVLHGSDGLSRKGPAPGQASYYASFTDLETRGVIRTEPAGEVFPVEGVSWFDQEFGSNQLAEKQAGWDWFSLHLSDGRDLMLYVLRLKDGTVEPASSGTLVERDGTARHIRLREFAIDVREHWKSPRSEAEYPSGWRVAVPEAEIDLTLAPLVADQELMTEGSTRVVYWEGAVSGAGKSGGTEVTCEGYVEMTGYAEALGGQF
jgi:predicted secreted hydrolase